MALDTTVFEQKEFSEAINKLEELLSHSKAVQGRVSVQVFH